MLPVVFLVCLAANASGQAEKLRREPVLYSVRLADGSEVNLRLLTQEIEIATRQGKLKVPLADIRQSTWPVMGRRPIKILVATNQRG
jgi:hypothetical protein